MGFWKIRGRLAAGILAAAMVLGGCRQPQPAGTGFEKAAEAQRLTVYTSHKPEVYEPIIKEFEERTGIWVQVKAGGTTELLEEIRKESGKNTCDIMFGGGVESYEVYKDCFAAYKSGQSDMLNDKYFSGESNWTVFTDLPIVLIYNNKLVSEEQAPEGWADLLSGRWQGKIAFADPGKSGSSCTMLATMIQILDMGEEETLRQFAEALDGRVSGGSGTVLEEVASGTRLVGVTLEETARKYIAKGADLSVVYPKEGTSSVPDGCAIVKGAPNEENAKLFLEFIVSRDVQRLAVEKLYRRTVRLDIPQDAGSETGKIVDFDLEWAVEHQEEILSCWERLMEMAEGTKAV